MIPSALFDKAISFEAFGPPWGPILWGCPTDLAPVALTPVAPTGPCGIFLLHHSIDKPWH